MGTTNVEDLSPSIPDPQPTWSYIAWCLRSHGL